MSEPVARVALNATAYDGLPSGARRRAAGLAAALVRAGADVIALTPRRGTLRPDVEAESEGMLDDALYREIATPLDPGRPVLRALAAGRQLSRFVPLDADLFVTDYYPVLRGVTTVLTVHDLRYLAASEHEPRARSAWFRAFYPRLAQRAPHVVVPSRSVAAEAVALLGLAPERLHVIPNGLGRAWRAAPTSPLPPEHLLFLGTDERRKGLRPLLRALAEAPNAPPLLVAGRASRTLSLALDAAPSLRGSDRVRAVGEPSDETLVDLVRRSYALVHPSRYEGFGLPVMEALAVGVPVLAVRQAAVAEAASEGAVWLDPDDMPAWSRALDDPATIERPVSDETIAAARARSWDAAAAALLALSRR